MGFGPFLSKEEKQRINNQNYVFQPPVSNTRLTAEQKKKAIDAAAAEALGLNTPPSQVMGPGGPGGFGHTKSNDRRRPSMSPLALKARKEAAAARKRTSELKARQALIEKNKLQDTSSDLPPAAPVLPSPVSRDVLGSDGVSKGTQTSPGGNGKPIIMDMTAANTLYKSRGLDSYRSGNKGFINDYNLNSQDLSKFFTSQLTGDFIPKSVAGNMKGYMDDISSTAFSPSTNGQIEGLSIKDYFNNPIKLNTAGMSMSEALADTESMRGPITEEGKLQRARAAFLNADNSMDGLRAQERELDIIYAGGKHYVANDNGGFETNPDGTNAAADAEQIKQLKSGAITPQLFKEGFKADLINRHASKPSQGENPDAQAPKPVQFITKRAVDFGSTDSLGAEFDKAMGASLNQSNLSNINYAFNTDIDLSEYIPGSIFRTPTMR